MTTHLIICNTHGTWDLDFDSPECSCDDLELMVIEEQEELPFNDEISTEPFPDLSSRPGLSSTPD